jgi:energy-coupling factor transporter ATP-binding protein EcfA2
VTNQDTVKNDLIVKDLRFIYPPPKRVEAIKRINLEIEEGEFAVIIGHNGSGKTTLSKLISGFLEPTEGTVTIGGKEVKEFHPVARPTVVGYVFQNPDHQVFKESVWEDVAFGLENLGLPQEEIERKTETVLERLDLIKHAAVHPFRLGKGDRQRVAVAAILVMNPKVLIVDEPTTGQDPERARGIMRLMTELNQEEKITVITITHAMDLVVEFGERVIAMGQGEILLDGPPREVFSQPEILAKTFVSPPQIIRCGIEVGLDPLPLNVDEAATQIATKIKQARS